MLGARRFDPECGCLRFYPGTTGETGSRAYGWVVRDHGLAFRQHYCYYVIACEEPSQGESGGLRARPNRESCAHPFRKERRKG
jgi:hypothetical protein